MRSVGRIDSIGVADVRWIGAAGNYVELHLADRVLLHRVTLATLEARLDPGVFLRVHSGAKVAVSQRYVDEVRAAMGR